MNTRTTLRQLSILLLICILVTAPRLFADDGSWSDELKPDDGHKMSIGISTTLQTDQLTIIFPLWLSRDYVLSPGVHFVNVENRLTDFGFYLTARRNLGKSEKAVPYIGIRGGLLRYSPSTDASKTDYLFGLVSGGEYFLDDHFSFGVEAQLTVTKSGPGSERFNNPDKRNINTAAVAMASYYF